MTEPWTKEMEDFRQLMDFLGVEVDYDRLANEIGDGVEVTYTQAAPFTLCTVNSRRICGIQTGSC